MNRRRNVQGTGGGLPKIVNFTDLEEQLLEILSPEAAGIANIPQGGFKSKKVIDHYDHSLYYKWS